MRISVPVEDKNMSPSLVLAYRILSPRRAFCTVNVIRLTYFKALVFPSEINMSVIYSTKFW